MPRPHQVRGLMPLTPAGRLTQLGQPEHYPASPAWPRPRTGFPVLNRFPSYAALSLLSIISATNMYIGTHLLIIRYQPHVAICRNHLYALDNFAVAWQPPQSRSHHNQPPPALLWGRVPANQRPEKLGESATAVHALVQHITRLN